ncbi:MAG: hypothetical protein H7X85_10900, partial [Thermoanaerobaculia bacterium]|nr:hypothetical protein [Thermoanaerobaculia bacterium]
MRFADALPRFLLSPTASFLTAARDDGNVEGITGLSPARWRVLGRAFPRLGPDPGTRAARARLRLEFLAGRALATQRHAPSWRGAEIERSPAMYVTAHIGDLRALRYLLRLRTAAASVIPEVENRERFEREDADRDARALHPGFPHVFSATRPHRLRSALRTGSLIAAADRPADRDHAVPLLGGSLPLDVRPFRLARIAGVPVRPLFLTAPG